MTGNTKASRHEQDQSGSGVELDVETMGSFKVIKNGVVR